ncbi:MAG: ECF-type sigma factor [Bacteroidota bacterium]
MTPLSSARTHGRGMAGAEDVTVLLDRAQAGEAEARDRLVALVYDELRLLARSQRGRHSGFATINTTALVHEAYEKLSRRDRGWADRHHYFRVAARAMRDVLVDYARAQRTTKRGGGTKPLSYDDRWMVPDDRIDEVIGLDEALARLAELDARRAEIVELRYFVGLTIAEAAEVMGISEATVKRDWTVARAWLHRELQEAA